MNRVRCAAAEPVSFRSEVAPIFLENCISCHGPKKAEGGYRIDTFDELKNAGDSGESPLTSGDTAKSELLRRLTTADAAERMPADSEPLTKEQIEIVNRWIAAGAAFDGEKPNSPLHLVIPPRTYADPPATYAQPLPVTALAFTPDESQLVVAGYHELTVWNAADATLARRIKNIPERIFSLAFLPDGKTLVVGCGEPGRSGEVRLVDFESGSVKSVLARTNDVVLDVALRPKSNEAAVGSADGMVRVVNLETLAEVRALASHADWVTAVAWSDDGTRLASGSRDKSAKAYDGNTGELLANYQGHAAAVRGVGFSPDCTEVLSTGADNKLHRWKIDGAKRVSEVPTGGEAYHIVRGDGFVLVPSADKQLRQIETSKYAVTRTLTGHKDWILSSAVALKASKAASGSVDGEVRLWNLADGALLHAWVAKP